MINTESDYGSRYEAILDQLNGMLSYEELYGRAEREINDIMENAKKQIVDEPEFAYTHLHSAIFGIEVMMSLLSRFGDDRLDFILLRHKADDVKEELRSAPYDRVKVD